MAETLPHAGPSSQGTRQSEVSITSGVSLLMCLSSDEVDTQELINRFWRSCSNWNTRGNVLVGLMFSAAGCHTLDYENFDREDPNNFPSNEKEDAEKVEDQPPALEMNFLARYYKFIAELFETIPPNHDGILFLRELMKTISQMVLNPWDSVRCISSLTGLKLLTFCINSSQNSTSSYAKKQFTSMKSNLMKGVFRIALRDVCVNVRMFAQAEMTFWSKSHPRYLLSENCLNGLWFGIHDHPQCAIYSLTAVEGLFQQDLYDRRQSTFFIRVHDSLVAFLGQEGGFSETAMSALASAIGFFKHVPRSGVKDLIYLAVYHRLQAVGTSAAKYFFKVELEKDVSNPIVVLKKLMIFQMESAGAIAESSEGLLMDSQYPLLKGFISWEHWEQLMYSCEAECVAVAVKMFHAYVTKALTNSCPPGRVKSADSCKKKDLLAAANGFTSFWGKKWKGILSLDKIRLNEKAMAFFTLSMSFFNTSLPSMVAFDILNNLSQVVKVSSSEAVLKGAWTTISQLTKIFPWDTANSLHLNAVFESVKNAVVDEFSESLLYSSLMMGTDTAASMKRLLYVIKFCDPLDDYNSLWDKCCQELDFQYALKDPDVFKVGKILQVLHRILIDQCSKAASTTEFSPDGSEEAVGRSHADSQMEATADMMSHLLGRSQYLQNRAMHFVTFGEQLKLLCFDIFVDIVAVFGRHMMGHPTLMMIADSVREGVESHLVEAACQVVRKTDCKDMLGSERFKEETACCHMLKYVCLLITTGMIKFSNMGKILMLADENEDHDLMIMAAIREYAEKFPGKDVIIAAVLVSSLIDGPINELSALEGTQDYEKLWETVIEKVMRKLAYWKKMDDFRIIVKSRKIRCAIPVMMNDLALRSNNPYLISAISEMFPSDSFTTRTDAESGACESAAAPESDFSLAFAERSIIPHSTPMVTAMSDEVSPSSED